MIQTHRLHSSKSSVFETPEQQIVQLTEKVKTLTESLRIKTEQVEYLLSLSNNQVSEDQLNQLSQAIEYKSKEIKEWEDKYTWLQQQNLSKLSANNKFGSSSILECNYSNNAVIVEPVCQNNNEDVHEFCKSKLQSKQEEINCLKFQVLDLQGQLMNQNTIVKELQEIVKNRENEQYDKQQLKSEMKEQLQNYKYQIMTLQDIIDNRMNQQTSFIEIDDLQNQIEQQEKIIEQQNQQIIDLKKQLEPNKFVPQVSHLNIQNMINSTMADINRSLEQTNVNNPSFSSLKRGSQTTKQSSPN